MKTLKSLLWLSALLLCIASCSKDEVIEQKTEVPEGKIQVNTEVTVDGVVQTNTRAVSEAGYTTGDGLYDEGDPVTVSAVANNGYELVRFYDKSGDGKYQGKSSYTFKATIPQTFRAEFAKKYTITASASPTDGGTVTGGGEYRSGKICTLTATANANYSFDGWYENDTKVSSDMSYSFTVSSNRTITGLFDKKTPEKYSVTVRTFPEKYGNDSWGGPYYSGFFYNENKEWIQGLPKNGQATVENSTLQLTISDAMPMGGYQGVIDNISINNVSIGNKKGTYDIPIKNAPMFVLITYR